MSQDRIQRGNMAKLADYGGEFDPKFSHDKFSKKTLLRLLKAYFEYMRRIDAFWYATVMDRWGNDEAFNCDVRVWGKGLPYEIRVISSLLGIHGDDVATVMKYLQVSPWMRIHEYEIDMKSSNHAVVTHFTCPILLAMEKEGKGREKLECQELEPKVFRTIAHYFNPSIKVTGLKVPPRTSYSDVCCQWEYKLPR
jgi:hypothetical protein